MIVKNTELTKSDGAAWEGELIDIKLEADDGDNILDLLIKGLKEKKKSTSGIDKIKKADEELSICDLADSKNNIENSNDNSEKQATASQTKYKWHCYVNDKDIERKYLDYSIAAGKLKDGDKIRFEYEKEAKSGEAGNIGEQTGGNDEAINSGDVPGEVVEPQLENANEELSLEMLALLSAAMTPEENAAYQDTGNYIVQQGIPSSDENAKAICLSRSGKLSSVMETSYLFEIESYLNANNINTIEASKMAEMVLSLTSIGRDPTSIANNNLLSKLGDYSYLTGQGVYGEAWALIAFDSKKYAIPSNSNASNSVTRTKLIENIAYAQQTDGSWTSTQTSSMKMTALAMQALSSYGTSSDAKDAVEKGYTYISNRIKAGDFYFGADTDIKDLSQVIITMTSMGKDFDKNSDLKYNGNTLIDTLMLYYAGNGTFKGTLGGTVSNEATEAAYSALTAYNRKISGKNAYYNMLDVVAVADKNAAAKVEKLIDSIDKHITRNSEDGILKARKAYNALSDSAKELVGNYEKLVNAEKDFAKIKKSTAARRAGAHTVRGIYKKANSLINSVFTNKKGEALKLPSDPSKLSKKQLKAIWKAYEYYSKLTDAQKKKVERYKEFEKLISKLEAYMNTDKKSGILIEGIEWRNKLIVEKQEYSGGDIRKIERTTGENAELLESYNIYIKDIFTGKKVLPKEAITVKIPKVNLRGHKMPLIAHEYADNKFEFIECENIEGYHVFTAQTFSPFSVVGFDGTWSEVGMNNYIRVGIFIVLGMLLLLLASIAIFSRRSKKANRMENYIQKHINS